MEIGLGEYGEPVDEGVADHQVPREPNLMNSTSSPIASTEDQLLRCRLERFEDEEIRKLEEDRLQEIIRLCQSYNDSQEGKRVRSLRVNEVDRLLELMKNPDVVQSTTVDNNRLVSSMETPNDINPIGLGHTAVEEMSKVIPSQDNSISSNERKCGENVHANGSTDDNDAGCAKLTALSIEESLIRGEIDDMKHQQFSDAEDEELKEFQRIEKEIKLNELYKCLETIEKEIIAIKQQQQASLNQPLQLDNVCLGAVKDSKEAPLASCESDESTSSDDDASFGDKVKSADYSLILHKHQNLNNHHTYSSIYSNETNSESLDSSKNEIDGENKIGANESTVNPLRLRRGNRENGSEDLKERQQRPLTIYLPSTSYDLDLIDHIVNLGHDVDSFAHLVRLTPTSCSGYLWKLCSNTENQWRKRYFLFDRQNKVFLYFKSFKSFAKAKKAKYGVYFNQIEDAYVDHNRTKLEKKSNPLGGSLRRRSNSTRYVFAVVTSERNFTLSTFVPEVMRIWIDVIFTGAEGYLSFE
ncbi:pleckstrin homology-like domain family B member 2 isoform X2 [Tetranychus urticae]|uniref:pleckstrin homology-like domain family B member 2 isoform X2 n=1 Tax=Tetranychus urticae TaxID=32264 RepID=UPI000D65D10F|nr:pleckstrin homology-like domain family B member 2 isoform X2 [Tetranychus urticae]